MLSNCLKSRENTKSKIPCMTQRNKLSFKSAVRNSERSRFMKNKKQAGF